MKPETYTSIALLVLFVVFTAVANPIAKEVLYIIGCFAVGWSIPTVSKTIVNQFRKVVA